MATPEQHLATAFVFEADHRITTRREPNPSLSARFVLARGATEVAWAVRTDVPANVAAELDALAASEPVHAGDNWTAPPVHEERYRELLAADDAEFDGGPVFTFPDTLAMPDGVAEIRTERELSYHFHGWVHGEISDGRAPVFAVVEGGHPVSICFSARRSNTAAHAGVETAERYRTKGYATRVVTAWAAALAARGVRPLYATSWTNDGSLGVARRLGLATFASEWVAQ